MIKKSWWRFNIIFCNLFCCVNLASISVLKDGDRKVCIILIYSQITFKKMEFNLVSLIFLQYVTGYHWIYSLNKRTCYVVGILFIISASLDTSAFSKQTREGIEGCSNSLVQKNDDKFPNQTGTGVRRSKRLLLACNTHCRC